MRLPPGFLASRMRCESMTTTIQSLPKSVQNAATCILLIFGLRFLATEYIRASSGTNITVRRIPHIGIGTTLKIQTTGATTRFGGCF